MMRRSVRKWFTVFGVKAIRGKSSSYPYSDCILPLLRVNSISSEIVSSQYNVCGELNAKLRCGSFLLVLDRRQSLLSPQGLRRKLNVDETLTLVK